MDPLITKRLSRDMNYKQPDKTYQQSLSIDDINTKLQDYEKVDKDNIFKIPLNTHVRYFTKNHKTGATDFRLGGIITKFGDNGQYIVLSNGKLSWSVQINNSIFYKKLSINEIKQNIKTETLKEIKKESKDSKNINDIIEENKKLKSLLKEIKETTIQSKNKKKNNN
jgi:hypothetical protein